MKEYIYISGDRCGAITSLKIIACSEMEAFAKAYSYFGGNSMLPIEDFNILCRNTDIDTVKRLFNDFVSETILYFGESGENIYVDELTEVDIIKCY